MAAPLEVKVVNVLAGTEGSAEVECDGDGSDGSGGGESSLLLRRQRALGTAFCFLPLPAHTGLPLHVNAFFELSTNRRDVWWVDVSQLGIFIPPTIDTRCTDTGWANEHVQKLAGCCPLLLNHQRMPLAYVWGMLSCTTAV